MAALYPVMNVGLKQKSDTFILEVFNKIILWLPGENIFVSSCIMLIIVSFIAVFFKYIFTFFSNKLMANVVQKTQSAVFEKYVSADYAFFGQNQQGELIHTATISPINIKDLVIYVFRLSYDVINTLFMFSLMLMLSLQGTLLLVLIGFLYGVLVKYITKNIVYRNAVIAIEEDRKINIILNELIAGIKSIKIFLAFDWWREKYIRAVEKSAHHRFKQLMGQVFPQSFSKLVFYCTLAALGIVISHRSAENLVASLPLFGTFVIVASRLFPSLQMIGTDLMVIAGRKKNMEIVYDLCTSKLRKIQDGTIDLERFDSVITFENVWFKYDSRVENLLKGLTFTIKKKQVTAIVGESGSGKTTIVNLLLKLYEPKSGEIKIDGVNIFNYTNRSYLKKIGYVGQETFLFNDTIMENIVYGIESCTDDMVIRAAKLANAHEFIKEMQNGYGTVVGDSGMRVSGGQRQRIAIARAMLREPEILILDEATSSLDNIAEKNVQEAINRIAKNTTVVVIAHRLSTVQSADKIISLEGGSIQEEGTHDELIKKGGLYQNLHVK
jgi:ATP-binding cassette subfamily B protein